MMGRPHNGATVQVMQKVLVIIWMAMVHLPLVLGVLPSVVVGVGAGGIELTLLKEDRHWLLVHDDCWVAEALEGLRSFVHVIDVRGLRVVGHLW